MKRRARMDVKLIRNFIGIEREAEYMTIAKARIEHENKQGRLL